MSGHSTPTSIPGLSLPNIADNPINHALEDAQTGGLAEIPRLANALKPQVPDLQSPDSLSSTPTLAQTNTTALQGQLASESAASTYGSFLTSGAGLLTSPTTSSRILLGS